MDEEEWKTAYDVQIYVTSLSAISDCNWNRLELWVNFHQDGFIYKLRHYYPVLSEDDIHVILLLRIDFSNAQISKLFQILGSSFRIRRSRLKKKMNVSCESITDFIKSLVWNDLSLKTIFKCVYIGCVYAFVYG